MSELRPRDLFGFDACDETQPFIFVSYAHQDAERIAPFLRHLNDSGISLWYDDGLKAGEDWLKMLLDKISSINCTSVIFFVSGLSVERPFVRAETHHAFSVKKPIYAVYLESGVSVDPSMGAYIGQIQSTFVRDHVTIDSALSEVLSAAKLLVRRTPPLAVQKEITDPEIEELWREGEVLSCHRSADGAYCRLEDAEAKYRAITERNSQDYRGWLGLIKCRSQIVPADLEQASSMLADVNNFYFYMVSSDADDAALQRCTEYCDALWNSTLNIVDSQNDAVSSRKRELRTAGFQELANTIPSSKLLVSVSPAVTARYTDSVNSINEKIRKSTSSDALFLGLRRSGYVISCILLLFVIWIMSFTLSEALPPIAATITYVLMFAAVGLCVFSAIKLWSRKTKKRTAIKLTMLGSWVLSVVIFFTSLALVPAINGDYECKYHKDYVTITGYTGSSENLTIPKSIVGCPVKEIGSYSFKNNSSLESVVISDGVKWIFSWAFEDCTNLKEIHIPDSVTFISSAAFDGTSVTVYAPHEAEYYTSFTFPSSVKWVLVE